MITNTYHVVADIIEMPTSVPEVIASLNGFRNEFVWAWFENCKFFGKGENRFVSYDFVETMNTLPGEYTNSLESYLDCVGDFENATGIALDNIEVSIERDYDYEIARVGGTEIYYIL